MRQLSTNFRIGAAAAILAAAALAAAGAVLVGGATPAEAISAESGGRSTDGKAAGETERVYSKPTDEELRQKLTPIQYRVTQKDGTERPFANEYWDNKEPGIYVDVVSGEPLFASTEKYRSGTGWPSFWAPLVPENVVERTDYKIGVPRTEVRSKHGDSHLGHVFPDGPRPTGLRYCLNSASLRFIPVDRLEAEGYGEFLGRFEGAEADSSKNKND